MVVGDAGFNNSNICIASGVHVIGLTASRLGILSFFFNKLMKL